MAHNLLIQNGQASMFYINEVPWHGLGTQLDQPATAQEAIQAAKLDWKVVKLPLFAGSKRIAVPDRFAVVRRTNRKPTSANRKVKTSIIGALIRIKIYQYEHH